MESLLVLVLDRSVGLVSEDPNQPFGKLMSVNVTHQSRRYILLV